MTRASTIAIALTLPLLLGSCATLNDWSSSSEAVTPSRELAARPTTAPEDADLASLMARMNQLEQDMAEVRIEMSRILPAIDQLNANIEQSHSSHASNLEAAPTNRMSDAAPPPVEQNLFAVHLASYRNREGAREGWQELRGRFGPVLNGLEPRISEVEIEDRGTFYRLKAGPFTNWAGANEVCDYLRGESWSCAVMDFSGEATE